MLIIGIILRLYTYCQQLEYCQIYGRDHWDLEVQYWFSIATFITTASPISLSWAGVP